MATGSRASFEQKPIVISSRWLRAAYGRREFQRQQQRPAWSPMAGARVVPPKDGNSQIYLVNTDGSNVVRLTNTSTIDTEPNFRRTADVIFTSDWQSADLSRIRVGRHA
jgi:TolB protein